MPQPNGLTLYTWDTPNGAKPVIVCEEVGIPCNYKAMDMFSPELKSDWYTAINPNGKIPALVNGSLKLFESGAILLYLVDTYDEGNKVSFEKGTAEYWRWWRGWLCKLRDWGLCKVRRLSTLPTRCEGSRDDVSGS